MAKLLPIKKDAPKKKRKSGKGENVPFAAGIAGGAAMLAAIAAMVVLLLLSDRKKSPQNAIEDYYRALAEGEGLLLENLVPASVQHALAAKTGGSGPEALAALPQSGTLPEALAKDHGFFGCGEIGVDAAKVTAIESEAIPEQVTALLDGLHLTAEEVSSCKVTVSHGGHSRVRTDYAYKTDGKWYSLRAAQLAHGVLAKNTVYEE